MNDRISDETLLAAEEAGLSVVERLRGVNVCCQADDNIVFKGKEVDGTFDPNNPEHLQRMRDSLQECFCKVCGTKYYAHSDLRDRVLMVKGR